VIYSGTFTAGKSAFSWPDGKMKIEKDGDGQKFVKAVEQITYSGTYGRERGQRVLYITERAVFRLAAAGVELIEIAPGVDIERDIVAKMGFAPKIAADLKTMDARLFKPGRLKLADDLHRRAQPPRSPRLELPKAAQ
jgi:propionate CoA-transferase